MGAARWRDVVMPLPRCACRCVRRPHPKEQYRCRQWSSTIAHPAGASDGPGRVDCSDRHRAADYPSPIPCVVLLALMRERDATLHDTR
jgi:hypothetical protein